MLIVLPWSGDQDQDCALTSINQDQTFAFSTYRRNSERQIYIKLIQKLLNLLNETLTKSKFVIGSGSLMPM